MTAKSRMEKTAERSGARMAGEDRRAQIVEVAIRLFSQKGFRGTTTKEIALVAGINEAMIFRHFATKSELYAAIIDRKANSPESRALEEALQGAMSRGDDREVFEALAFHILEFHDHDDTAMRVLFYSALEGHELAQMIFETYVTRIFRRLADYITQRVGEGAFRCIDPMTAVRAFLGMVVYHAMANKFFGRELLDVTNRQAAERFTDIFLAGITSPGYHPQSRSIGHHDTVAVQGVVARVVAKRVSHE